MLDDIKLVPKLRFPEFDDKNYEQVNLGNISTDSSYGLNTAATDFDGENKYIRITDIDEQTHKFRPNPLTSPEGNLEDKFLLKENDLLFARTGASTGKSYLYDKNDGKLYFAGFLIKFNINKANAKFVFYNTLKNSYNNWVSIMSVRSGQPGINMEEYKKLKIFLPSIKEQEKIASFLSKIDEKIDLLNQKLDQMKQFKKGLMQQIFSQKLRFDGFTEDWKRYKLKEICSIIKGKQLNKDDMIKNGKYYVLNGGINPSGFTNEWNCNENTISISEGGNSCGYINFNTEKFWSGGHCYTLNSLKDNFNVYYIFSCLKANQLQIMRLRVGSGLPNIQKGDIENFKINIPTKKEQEKIANFLSKIDEKIDLLNQKLEQMKQFKKGLMQQIFAQK